MKLFSLVILQFVLFFVNIESRTFYKNCLNGNGGEIYIHGVDFADLGLSTEPLERQLIQIDYYATDDSSYGFSGPVVWDNVGAEIYFLECPSEFTGSDKENEYVDADWKLVCHSKVIIDQDDYPYTELEVIYNKKNSDDQCFEGFSDYELKEGEEPEKPTTITDIPNESDNESEDESENKGKTHSSNKISKWKCGKGIGKCQSGYCCSKYGWCGKASAYCSIEKGCQSEFGICNKKTSNESDNENGDETSNESDDESDDEKNSKDHKKKTSKWQCGKRNGKCPKGYCCSKYGECGKGSQYCSKKEGCQTKFGICW